MSGHSKWATTKRQKAITDARKGSVFTKFGNLITVAAREKGGNPETNFSLRMAIEKAKSANMPKENIERAIKRGTGEIAGESIEELYYEGFGPAKTQFIIKTLTDNKNRTAANIRHLFTDHGGALGTVMWNFSTKGVIRVANDEMHKYNPNLQLIRASTNGAHPNGNIENANSANYEYANKSEGEDFDLQLIDSGAQDILKEKDGLTIYTNPEDLQKVKNLLDKKNITTESAEIEYVAKDTITLAGEDRDKVLAFQEALDDCEDVADYYTNMND